MYRPRAPLLQVMGLFLIYLLAACQAPVATPTARPTPGPTTIGFSISTLNDPFFVAMQRGALEAANRLGAELIIQNAQNHSDRQASQIEDLLAREVDAVIINPVDGEAIANLVLRANEAGIPVFTIDRRVTAGEVVTHIASDNLSGGQMAAEYLVDMIGETGNVVELQGMPGASATQERGKGFVETLDNYAGVKIVASAVGNFDRWQGRKAFEQILEEQRAIDAVFAHNDQMVLGAIEAAQEAGRADEMIFVGFDGTSDAVVAMEQGELTATVAQQPAEMGRLGIELAVEYLQTGESLTEFTLVDLALIAQ